MAPHAPRNVPPTHSTSAEEHQLAPPNVKTTSSPSYAPSHKSSLNDTTSPAISQTRKADTLSVGHEVDTLIRSTSTPSSSQQAISPKGDVPAKTPQSVTESKGFQEPLIISVICIATLLVGVIVCWGSMKLIQKRRHQQMLQRRRDWVPPKPSMRDSMVDSDVGLISKGSYRERFKSWASISDGNPSGSFHLKQQCGAHMGSIHGHRKLWADSVSLGRDEPGALRSDPATINHLNENGTNEPHSLSYTNDAQLDPPEEGHTKHRQVTRWLTSFHEEMKPAASLSSGPEARHSNADRIAPELAILPSDSVSRVGKPEE